MWDYEWKLEEMANQEQVELLKRSAYAWNDWRRYHPELEPDLTGAQFADEDLGSADLVLADFGQADLRRAKLAKCKLAGARFAGADLTGAELPEWVGKQLESLSTVKEISSNAQKLFIAMLAACLYSWLTIATTTDINLISNRATSSLPIIQTTVPIVGFFFIGPLVLLGAYFYLHFYLQKLWDELGLLPAVFPDGNPLHRKTDPWLLTDLVVVHSKRLRGKSPFLVNLQIWVSVFLTWWVVPLTLFLFWNRYLDRQEFYGTIFHSIACAASVSSAIFLYRLARNTLRGTKRVPFSWRSAASPRTWAAPLGTGIVVASVLTIVAVGAIWGVRSGSIRDNYWPHQTGPRSWVPKTMALYGFSPFADLRAAELSVKPASLKPNDSNVTENIKGIQLSGASLRYADMRASFLANSFLTSADLEGADLLGADLEGSGMIDTDLRGASLANADLKGTSMARANLDGADIKYADFTNAQGLTADQLRAADGWCEAFYDEAQLKMLGLPANNNDKVMSWQQFDANNSSLSQPTTVEAAREAELRRFSALRTRVRAPAAGLQATGSRQPAAADRPHPRLANELAKYYNFPAGLDGTGQTVGIIELDGGYQEDDLDHYFKSLGLPRPRVSWVSVDGHVNTPGGPPESGAEVEVELNLEIVGTVAPGAKLVAYFSGADPKGFLDAVDAAINDKINSPSILLIAWGSPELSSGPNNLKWNDIDLKQMNASFETAAKRNITVVVASGDHGARDETTEERLQVSFPSSSPWVLSVGATRLVNDGGSGPLEAVWNDSSYNGASGGGVSEIFDRPRWQSNIRVPHSLTGRPGRGVPDVAINADPESGYILYVQGHAVQLGGTSVSASMWAGLVAVLNQGLGRNLGFFNPLLYERLGPAGVFHSVLHGHNGIGELSGFCAGPGWNAATGWGTPDGTRLLQTLKSMGN
jgi:kumamolisin